MQKIKIVNKCILFRTYVSCFTDINSYENKIPKEQNVKISLMQMLFGMATQNLHFSGAYLTLYRYI